MTITEVSQLHYKAFSKEWKIARELLNGKNREEVIRNFWDDVGKLEPFIFRENTGQGSRRPKPILNQYSIFLYVVSKTINEMVERGWSSGETLSERKKWTDKSRHWVTWRRQFIQKLIKEAEDRNNPVIVDISDFTQSDVSVGTFIPNPPAALEIPPEPLPNDVYDQYGNLDTSFEYDEDKKVVSIEHHPKPTVEQRLVRFYEKLMQAREFVIRREISGQALDFISTRALKDGCKAIYHGISENEIMEAITKTWPQDSKNELKNWTTLWKPEENTTIDWEKYYTNDIPGAHRYLGYVIKLANARVPIFLVGPSGCGKSFLARDLADALDLNYAELPLTAGATPSWLVGAETMSGYKTRPFVEIYRYGGVFNAEEMDGADANMLLLLNNALANDFLTNPITGEEIPKHADFVPVATGNTWGLGANRQFTGRERLDAATLDRWRVGRVEMDYDVEIEQGIVDYYVTAYNKKKDKRKIKKVRKSA